MQGLVSCIKDEKVALLISDQKGRAAQMNYPGNLAKSPIFYFLHADAIQPNDLIQIIIDKCQSHCKIYCFRCRFQSN